MSACPSLVFFYGAFLVWGGHKYSVLSQMYNTCTMYAQVERFTSVVYARTTSRTEYRMVNIT